MPPATYGIALYGQILYGNTLVPTPTPGGSGYLFDPPYCPVYQRFMFWGENLGYYMFEMNPRDYDPRPQRDTQVYQVIADTNPTFDKDYNKMVVNMSWEYMPERMWNAILPYMRKKVDGSSEALYFYDAQITNFNWTKVKVEALRGEARGGYEPVHRFNVSLKLRVATT